MVDIELRVASAGLASVQDLGRPGHGHLGIPENGAADGWAAQVANVLTGNPAGAPLIEITGSELVLTADVDLLIAVTGAAPAVLVAGVAQPVWEPLVVPSGWSIAIPAPGSGLRSYLAVNGHLDSPRVLGSVAPDRLLGTGRSLRTGDTLHGRSSFAGVRHPFAELPLFRLGCPVPRMSQPLVVETTVGPDAAEFPDHAAGRITAEYEVAPESDGIGLRLLGPTPQRSGRREILSRGVPVGAIEVPPAGGLLLLLRGRLVTAGYPVLAVATLESIDRLGQARVGDRIRFDLVDASRARETFRQRHRQLDTLATRVNAAFTSTGLTHVLQPQHTRDTRTYT